jgi:hypothetical protein
MKKIPKIKEFKAPNGYFENLPDQIIAGIPPKVGYSWTKWAAAAVLVLGFGFWQSGLLHPKPAVLSFDQQSELFIESQYWTAEEVLSMSEDPNAVLDEIIQEELAFTENIWTEEEQTWF